MSEVRESRRDPEAARPVSPDPRRWRRVNRGMVFLAFGTFLLLTTLDVLPWSYWGSLLPFWPVLLVMLGLRLMFERSALPWAVLLSPLLLFATMTWVAVDAPTYAAGPARPVRADRAPEADAWRLQGDLAMVRLDIVGRPLAPDVFLEGEARGQRRRPWVSVGGRGSTPRVRLRNVRSGTFGPFPGRRRGELEAFVADDLPLAVDLDAAVVEGELDLAGVPVTRVDLDGALLELTIRLGAPSEDTVLSLDGAFNRLVLIVPGGTPVRYDTEGAINVVRRHDGAPGRGPAYRLHVDGFCNWVTVRNG